MPKNLFQEIVFTVMMVFVMVYAMICYNCCLPRKTQKVGNHGISRN